MNQKYSLISGGIHTLFVSPSRFSFSCVDDGELLLVLYGDICLHPEPQGLFMTFAQEHNGSSFNTRFDLASGRAGLVPLPTSRGGILFLLSIRGNAPIAVSFALGAECRLSLIPNGAVLTHIIPHSGMERYLLLTYGMQIDVEESCIVMQRGYGALSLICVDQTETDACLESFLPLMRRAGTLTDHLPKHPIVTNLRKRFVSLNNSIETAFCSFPKGTSYASVLLEDLALLLRHTDDGLVHDPDVFYWVDLSLACLTCRLLALLGLHSESEAIFSRTLVFATQNEFYDRVPLSRHLTRYEKTQLGQVKGALAVLSMLDAVGSHRLRLPQAKTAWEIVVANRAHLDEEEMAQALCIGQHLAQVNRREEMHILTDIRLLRQNVPKSKTHKYPPSEIFVRLTNMEKWLLSHQS